MNEYDSHLIIQVQMKRYIDTFDEAIYQIDKLCEKLSVRIIRNKYYLGIVKKHYLFQIEEADLRYLYTASTVASSNSLDPPPPKKQALQKKTTQTSDNFVADGEQPTCSKYLQPESKRIFMDDENNTHLKMILSPKYAAKIDSDEDEVDPALNDLPATLSESDEKQIAVVNYSQFGSNIRNEISVPAPRKKFVLKKKPRICGFNKRCEEAMEEFRAVFDCKNIPE